MTVLVGRGRVSLPARVRARWLRSEAGRGSVGPSARVDGRLGERVGHLLLRLMVHRRQRGVNVRGRREREPDLRPTSGRRKPLLVDRLEARKDERPCRSDQTTC